MLIKFTKKDVIIVNQQFSNGNFNNESSLDFALSTIKESASWTKQLAYLTRAILIDHVFEEGNKRTACALILAITEINSYELHDKSALSIVTKTVLKNITSIKTIQEMIEDAITKK